jgi:hypothetical protein
MLIMCTNLEHHCRFAETCETLWKRERDLHNYFRFAGNTEYHFMCKYKRRGKTQTIQWSEHRMEDRVLVVRLPGWAELSLFYGAHPGAPFLRVKWSKRDFGCALCSAKRVIKYLRPNTSQMSILASARFTAARLLGLRVRISLRGINVALLWVSWVVR